MCCECPADMEIAVNYFLKILNIVNLWKVWLYSRKINTYKKLINEVF